MFRLTRQTDYAILTMAYMADNPQQLLFTARDLAEATKVPLPTVSKILKLMQSRDLLLSTRGAKGGYRLARLPREIALLEVIDALEGPLSLTECSGHGETACGCDLEPSCLVSGIWQVINGRVRDALRGITMADMVQETFDVERFGTSPRPEQTEVL